ncbi:MAG: transcriptional regulator [Bacteroidetes bacterium]|nr:transcriptional regulator [Bacteroidota bacterium]
MVQTQKDTEKKHDAQTCGGFIMPIRDTLDILSGKWKLPILGALMFGKKRFKEIEREIPNITARMLSKELKELEMNQLITRTVYATTPVTVEYEVTAYGRTLDTVLNAMKEWGTIHRKRIMAKKN